MMSSRFLNVSCGALTLSLLGGCSAAIRVDTPPSRVETPLAFDAIAAAQPAADTDIRAWWRGWNDPYMAVLIERALAANPDIRSAEASLAAARAMTTAVESALYPTLSLDASGIVGEIDWHGEGAWRESLPPYSATLPSSSLATGHGAGLSATWEADVFGGRRSDAEAARAIAATAEERLHGAHVLIAGEVASNYRQAIALRERLVILDGAIVTAGELELYVQARFAAGQASGADVANAGARLEELRSARPSLRNLLETRLRRLAVLGGLAPQQKPELGGDVLPPPAAPTGQLPSSVLDRRPDVRARRWTVQARAAHLKSLKSDLLPSFGIVFLGGEARLEFDDLPDVSGFGGLLGLRISLPLFNAGRLRAKVRAGDARLEAAVADYDQRMLAALEEVENAYSMRAALDARIAELQRSRDLTVRATGSSQAQFDAGQRTRDDVLQSRLGLARVDEALASARMQQALATVRLYQALGGGW